jgi:hypothetical protein
MTWLTGAARTDLSRWFRSDGRCGADAGVDRAVDHGPRVHGRPAEGGNPRSNLGLRSRIERLGTPAREGTAAGTPEGAAHGGQFAGETELEL